MNLMLWITASLHNISIKGIHNQNCFCLWVVKYFSSTIYWCFDSTFETSTYFQRSTCFDKTWFQKSNSSIANYSSCHLSDSNRSFGSLSKVISLHAINPSKKNTNFSPFWPVLLKHRSEHVQLCSKFTKYYLSFAHSRQNQTQFSCVLTNRVACSIKPIDSGPPWVVP